MSEDKQQLRTLAMSVLKDWPGALSVHELAEELERDPLDEEFIAALGEALADMTRGEEVIGLEDFDGEMRYQAGRA